MPWGTEGSIQWLRDHGPSFVLRVTAWSQDSGVIGAPLASHENEKVVLEALRNPFVSGGW